MTSTDIVAVSSVSWQIEQAASDIARYYEQGWWRNPTHLDDFLAHVEKHPDKVAIAAYSAGSDQPKTLTYGELGTLVDRCASTLVDMGIERGDIVSLQLPNGWEFPILTLATMRVGAIPNPIPVIYRELELSFMLRHAASKILVVPGEFRGYSHADLAKKLQQETSTLEHIVGTGDAVSGLINFEQHFLGKHREPDADLREEFERRRPKADDFAVLLFTSGTTGTPKAAIHTHNTIWSAGRPIPKALNLTEDDTCFMASTMGHLTGFYWGMLMPLSTGQKVVYQDVWDPRGLIDLIDTERITWTLSATPFAIDMIDAQKIAKRSLASLRAFVCGGAPIPSQTAIQIQEHLGVDLISLWGCTEVGICAIHQVGASTEVLANSDGMPVPWVELRIVDENLKPVEKHQEGRLQSRGPSICLGYLDQPELTLAALTPDGWFDTGDLGRVTSDGGIRISGRSKDIIIRGGQNIPIVEIENELLKMSSVKEVAVIGLPDPRLGERGCAVVVPTGSPPTLEDIKNQLKKLGMAKQYWPEHLELVDAMPRTPAGKIQKFVLRERFTGGKSIYR